MDLDRAAGPRASDFRRASVSPEFAALLVGLTTYTAAFIGEIVRGGVLAVDKGQSEAAAALGLSRCKILRLVVLPQALRVIIPPTGQFLNLVKNSSLAVAIGYPDLISITNTTLNQTGQAIEAIARDGRLSRRFEPVAGDERVQRGDSPTRRTRRMTAMAASQGRFGARRCSAIARTRSRRPSSAQRSRTPASGSSRGEWSTPSGRCPGMRARRRAARPGVRGRAGPSSPNAFASSCAAPIRSPSSGGRPSRVCCS